MVINMWDKAKLRKSFCELYSLDGRKLGRILKGCDDKYDPLLEFLKITGIKLDSIDVSNVHFKCRHITTISDDFKSIKKYGLMDLKMTLTEDTPLRNFLAEHEIYIDVEGHRFTYKDNILEIPEYKEDCKKCYYGKCKYHKEKWDGSVDLDYKNVRCNYRNIMHSLSTKLYYYKGEIEVFLWNTRDNMLNYSCVKLYPEILITIEKLVNSIFNDGVNICKKWVVKQHSNFYMLTFDMNINNFEYITNKATLNDKNYYINYLEFCNNEYDLLEDVTSNFWSNSYIISHAISVMNNKSSGVHGQVLPGNTVPFAKLEIEELKVK